MANTVKVHIPGELRAQVGSQNEIELAGASVKEVLGVLAERYPVLGKRLFGADGRLNRFVNIYLNDEDIRFLENLDTTDRGRRRDLDRAGDRRRMTRRARGRFQAALDSPPRRYPFPGATAAYLGGDGESCGVATGLATVEADHPMEVESRMLAGSIGKTFVAATAIAAAREGRSASTIARPTGSAARTGIRGCPTARPSRCATC